MSFAMLGHLLRLLHYIIIKIIMGLAELHTYYFIYKLLLKKCPIFQRHSKHLTLIKTGNNTIRQLFNLTQKIQNYIIR